MTVSNPKYPHLTFNVRTRHFHCAHCGAVSRSCLSKGVTDRDNARDFMRVHKGCRPTWPTPRPCVLWATPSEQMRARW